MANCPEVGIAYNAIWRSARSSRRRSSCCRPQSWRTSSDSGARPVLASPELADNAREAAAAVDVLTTDEFPELEEAEPSSIVPLVR